MSLQSLIASNGKRWNEMHINGSLVSTIDSVAKRLVAFSAKQQYQAVEKVTGVPWYIIAVIHEREASQSWNANIAQGDPWFKRSVHVPAGRGPFKNWHDAAIDALTNCAPHAARWHDWSPGGALTLLEQYNGLGYANMGKPSPYIWASTDQYVRGKYVSDGHYDANAVDHQLGCAALLRQMTHLDSSVTFGAPVPAAQPPPPAPAKPDLKVVPPAPVAPKPPAEPAPAKTGLLGAIVTFIAGVFGKRKS